MIVAILISVHLLADFLFQTSAYSEKKKENTKAFTFTLSYLFYSF